MAQVVHAVFGAEAACEQVAGDLAQRTDAHPSFVVQVHRGPVIDGDALPESATEVGRNTVMAAGVGAGAGWVLGAVAGSTLDVAGFNFATGSGLGVLFGGLVGVLSGLMAGTRAPKAALRDLAAGLSGSAVLVLVEVDDTAQAELAMDALRSAGGDSVGNC